MAPCADVAVDGDDVTLPTVVTHGGGGKGGEGALVVGVFDDADLEGVSVGGVAVGVEVDDQSVETVGLEERKDDGGVVLEVAVGAEAEGAGAAVLQGAIVVDAGEVVVDGGSVPAGGVGAVGHAFEVEAVGEEDVLLEGAGGETDGIAVLHDGVAGAIDDELVGGVGGEACDDEPLPMACELATGSVGGCGEACAGALLKAVAAVFDDDAVAVEMGADGVPPDLDAVGADVGVVHATDEAGADVEVVDVHGVVVGVGVGGAEGDVAACAAVA